MSKQWKSSLHTLQTNTKIKNEGRDEGRDRWGEEDWGKEATKKVFS